MQTKNAKSGTYGKSKLTFPGFLSDTILSMMDSYGKQTENFPFGAEKARKGSEAAFRIAGEGYGSAVRIYNSLSRKYLESVQAMLASINNQSDFLFKNGMKFWSGVLQTSDPGGKKADKPKKRKTKK